MKNQTSQDCLERGIINSEGYFISVSQQISVEQIWLSLESDCLTGELNIINVNVPIDISHPDQLEHLYKFLRYYQEDISTQVKICLYCHNQKSDSLNWEPYDLLVLAAVLDVPLTFTLNFNLRQEQLDLIQLWDKWITDGIEIPSVKVLELPHLGRDYNYKEGQLILEKLARIFPQVEVIQFNLNESTDKFDLSLLIPPRDSIEFKMS